MAVVAQVRTGVREGRDIVYLTKKTPISHLASNVHEGTRLAAHATTMGRTLLGELTHDELCKLYEGFEFISYSTKTRTTLSELEKQIKEDRLMGISWSHENFEPDIGSAAVIIRDYTGAAVGALNVTGQVSNFDRDTEQAQQIEQKLKLAAKTISNILGYRQLNN